MQAQLTAKFFLFIYEFSFKPPQPPYGYSLTLHSVTLCVSRSNPFNQTEYLQSYKRVYAYYHLMKWLMEEIEFAYYNTYK